ncbi:hypothetical protein [Nakamurella sp.]|uniref:hypothetical protein n=1 Tax=Nakamurella sp. TaxID=1869182 RepID=UPI0037836B1B
MTSGSSLRRHARATFGLARLDRQSLKTIARAELPQFARIVIVAAVGWQVCLWLGATVAPIYAVLVPLVSLKSDPFSAFNLSWSRLVGVLIGLLIGVGVTQVVSQDVVAVSLVLGLSLLIGMLVRIGGAPNLQIAISALLVFVSPDAGAYGLTRLWETGVGTVVTALLTPFLFPADPLKAARRELSGVANTLTASLRESVAVAGAADLTAAERMRQMVRVAERLDGASAHARTLEAQITSATKSAPWSVLRRGALREVGRLGPSRELASRTAANIRSFADEAIAFAEREEYAKDAQLRADALAEMTEPLADAIGSALTGQGFDDDLVRARAARQAFIVSEHSTIASVTRRPLNRILEDLERFAAT